MKLIVGLGNPGEKYRKTRHNIGFMVIDALADQKSDDFVLEKPGTFMNESGKAVKKLLANSKFSAADLVVVHDDIDLPLGEFKISFGRGSAGHKGVQSIIDALGTKDFQRIRIGICPEIGKPEKVEEFVLKKFTKEEEMVLKKVIEEIVAEMKNRG
jgi:PTH1 family peptidyl-tRNA hydrolase